MNTSELLEYGAVNEKNEDKYGDTHIGWWLDGVFLGKSAKDASMAILG